MPAEHDDAWLTETYIFTRFSVIPGTQISQRASVVISKLRSSSEQQNEKPILVALTAKSKSVGKLIAIVEVAKRELSLCYQYNTLSTTAIEIARKSRPAATTTDSTKQGDGGHDDDNDDDGTDDDGFEAVTTASDRPSTKKQSLSIMTIYLSTVPIRELKIEYG